ncbi:MAG: riboflavin synthase [Myxococcales bacterium]|nr:riboflavin synthase [Myxococcales bacterium]
MFTGLIEDTARVVRADRDGGDLVLELAPRTIRCAGVAGLVLGESIAVDGACLTVTRTTDESFFALLGPETLARTTLGAAEPGTVVNLERALLPTTRMGGHLVAGHVDAVGTIARLDRHATGGTVEFTFHAPTSVLRHVVEQGSIAVDGVSLTVTRVDDISFAVMAIPHTLAHTTLGDKGLGARVNLETDLLAKYVAKLVGPAWGARP